MQGKIVTTSTLDDFITDESFSFLDIEHETRAYIAGVFRRFVVSPDDDLSKVSTVLTFMKARESGDYVLYQRIGDWALWSGSTGVAGVNKDVIEHFGSLSYGACHRIMMGKWSLFGRLRDDLPDITRQIRCETKGAWVLVRRGESQRRDMV